MVRGYITLGCVIGLALAATAVQAGETLDLTNGWRFAPDPDQSGIAKGFHLLATDDSTCAILRSGSRCEEQGFPDTDGVAWYRKRVVIPESMRGEHVWLALGGITDAGKVYCNGDLVAAFGDEESVSVARTPVVADVTRSVRWGQDNLIAIRVFDWGGSGGLTQAPCVLTTDYTALPIHNLLQFVPGFEGRRSILGVDTAHLGISDASAVRLSVAVGDTPAIACDATMAYDKEGRAIAVGGFDLSPRAGDRLRLVAEVSSARADSPLRLEREYTWPEPPSWGGEYRHLKVLNNFVTELYAVAEVSEEQATFPFLNPREGWVFVRLEGKEGTAYLDAESEPLIWRTHPETGAYESMRYLDAGAHTIRLQDAKGGRLDVRAVPEIAFCYWPTTTVLKALPPRDRAFAERHIFPNTNLLLTRNDMSDEEFESWRREGRHWVNNASLLGLDDKVAPTTEAVYQDWVSNACVTRPGYSGIIVDEFLNSPAEHYAVWTAALERLYESPGFQGQTFTAWVVDTFQHEPGLAFMRRLHALGGRFAWERYIHEEPSEAVAELRIYQELGVLEAWVKLMPGLKERLTYCLGSFSIPWCSLNINPGVNFLPFMDRQFQVLATDPLFFGSRGIFQWAEHYTDDDALRFAGKLYRHYCLEGHRTPFTTWPYELKHIANPDFAEGLTGWRVESAGPDTVTADRRRGLGKIQGRWANLGVGDSCAILVRDEKRPNRVGQSIANLEPGRLYSMKFIAADLDNLGRETEVGLWPALEGVDLVPEGSYRYVMPSSYALDLDGFNRAHRAYTTYCQTLFRAGGTSAELTFSDWKDGSPAGPIGQRIGFNFVEIQPYFE